MLNQVYIFRIDDKDALITASVSEATEFLGKMKENPSVELVTTELRSYSATYNFKTL